MKHSITICMGSSCFARGNEKNLRVLQEFLKKNQMEADVELSANRCAGECSIGPNILIDGESYHHLDSEALIDLLTGLLQKSGKGHTE